MSIQFQTLKGVHTITVDPAKGEWLLKLLPELDSSHPKQLSFQEIKSAYEKAGLEDFELFWDNKPVNGLNKAGLLRV